MIIENMPSSEYHAKGNTFSSSQLKTMLEDPEIFYRKYISKEIAKEESPAFDIGTYFHTAILEPEILEKECAVFTGIRRGAKWEQFQIENKGKAIVTDKEYEQCLSLINAVKSSEVAMSYLSKGKAEVSAFITLLVSSGNVFSEDFVLTPNGWERAKMPKTGIELTIKCRADFLGDSYILDLKSTTGNAKNDFAMRQKVSAYSYDLSASLYLDIFSVALKKPMRTFLWTFASKDMGNSRTYVASQQNVLIGRAKWKKAVLLLAQYISNDWQFKDELGILEPNFYETEWIKTKEEDVL